jgi:hypothetical protein
MGGGENGVPARRSVSVSSMAYKAFTQRPLRTSVPSVLKALRHGDHGEIWPRTAMPKCDTSARLV